MTRDNIIYTSCGLLLGLIVGSFLIGPHLAKSPLAAAPAPAEAAAAPAQQAAMQGDPNTMTRVRQRLDALKKTLDRNPNDFDALTQLAGMYMDAAKYSQAAEYIERALRVRDDANLRADLAICYRQDGHPDRALEELQRVVKADPTQWQARFNEVVLLGEMQRFDEARAEMVHLKQLRPGDPEVQRLEQALAQAR
jgi:Flp pilus assembly protein TadD